MRRFIDRFDVLLFDVCGTLVYGYDRYGPQIDYYPAYTQLGGNFLSARELAAIVNRLHATISAAEKIDANYDPFPSLHDFALAANHTGSFPPGELERVEAVFAQHECGVTPPEIAKAVRGLHASHPLGIVSNLWGQAQVFEDELRRCDIRDLFWPRVWSPQVGCLKPARRIFQAALDALNIPPERILYTGDTFLRDVVGARRMGMAAAWVNPAGLPVPPEYGIQPDLVIPDITALLRA
jgi:HAD superfamily hydrolase (TIGR01549 family)